MFSLSCIHHERTLYSVNKDFCIFFSLSTDHFSLLPILYPLFSNNHGSRTCVPKLTHSGMTELGVHFSIHSPPFTVFTLFTIHCMYPILYALCSFLPIHHPRTTIHCIYSLPLLIFSPISCTMQTIQEYEGGGPAGLITSHASIARE
jgi:hypothetical protein